MTSPHVFSAVVEAGAGGGAYVVVPAGVVEALGARGRVPVRASFDAQSYSRRREHVTSIEEAKRPETRARRIAEAVERLRS